MRLALTTLFTLTLLATPSAPASQQDIPAPVGSGNSYADTVVVLPNGNIVVTDPTYSPSGLTNAGAVYLLDGATLAVISTLTGSAANNSVGSGGITLLSNGNFVVISPNWDNGSVINVGAVTWGRATTGFIGGGTVAVSAVSSLVGATANDQVGSSQVIALTNGHYVVASPNWDNAFEANAGAATWGNGSSGTVGTVSAANSLTGSHAYDTVGSVTALTNGHYVVSSQSWDNGGVVDAGMVACGNGNGGTVGAVSAANALVGSTTYDNVGTYRVAALTNGNYVVLSPNWDNGAVANAGAATWGNGNGGTVGAVSAANSLIGSTANDNVGVAFNIIGLTNGNYVILSPSWDNGVTTNVGAATWCNGSSGRTGTVSAANSLIGSTTGDQVGAYGVIPLTNGNYVVVSPLWSNGVVSQVGAVTWCNGSTGRVGAVSAVNSLVGSTTNDRVGQYFTGGSGALTNGHYVVCSQWWDNGAAQDAGAATWCNGSGGTVGVVSAANSLIGTAANDQVGQYGATALTNGNYVIASPGLHGVAEASSAITWSSGDSGTAGAISSANSLVGYSLGNSITALTNGNYVINSSGWANGTATNAGASTWCDGSTGAMAAISNTKSLVGSMMLDRVSSDATLALPNGGYLVYSTYWTNPTGTIANAGALSYGNSSPGGTVGVVSAANSILGTVTNGLGKVTTLNYDPMRSRVFVGRGSSKILSILTIENLQNWRVQHFGSAVNAGDAADTATPQHDGVTNLMKFATGLNPAMNTPQPGGVAKNGENLEFTFPRSIDAMAECTFRVEWSDTMLIGSWSSEGVTESILSATSTLQQVKATLPDGGGNARFVRLRVTTP